MDDDPREVLALLNSLGFIGITAEQLKAFMKDLKLYRKIKDRERQQKKEEIKKKIIEKQQSMMKEVLREQRTEFHLVENTVSSNSSSSYINGSHVRVKVKCLSNDKENNNLNAQKNHTSIRQKCDVTEPIFKSKTVLDYCSVKPDNIHCDNKDDKFYLKSKPKPPKCFKAGSIDEKQNMTKIETRKEYKEKAVPLQSIHPMSAPSILQHPQDKVGSSHSKSTSPKNPYSGKKSFIRPWRLQPDVQKSLSSKKSDPVTLFQKYQEEWKHISFPGEAKHASVRWAIREKMLGGDPHPIPLPKRSSSMPTLKRK